VWSFAASTAIARSCTQIRPAVALAPQIFFYRPLPSPFDFGGQAEVKQEAKETQTYRVSSIREKETRFWLDSWATSGAGASHRVNVDRHEQAYSYMNNTGDLCCLLRWPAQMMVENFPPPNPFPS
jgi:hypothetical protein